MAPETKAGKPVPGDPAKPDFVGWGALGPVAILFEYVMGIRADVPRGELVWDVRVTDRFGVKGYPFGATGLLDLECDARASVDEQPVIRLSSNMPVRVVLRWGKSASTQGGKPVDRSAVPPTPLHQKIIQLAAGSAVEVKP